MLHNQEVQAEAILRLCYGVYVPLPQGPCSVTHVLHHILGLGPDYVRESVQTILLDGLAVDGLDSPVGAQSRLALSAAMPGVVGATLRKGGHYAPMRQGITHPGNTDTDGAASLVLPARWLELRCFNDIAREQGMALLQRGYLFAADGLTPALENFAVSPATLARTLPPLPSAPSALGSMGWCWAELLGEHQ